MAAPKGGKRVLVIDDDALIRDIYRSLLKAAGFEVAAAPDGKTGLELLRKEKFDCVLLDMYMPGMSGLDVLEQMDSGAAKVPVIAISGSGGSSGGHPLDLAATLGAARTFQKDFEHDDLVKAVRELTGG